MKKTNNTRRQKKEQNKGTGTTMRRRLRRMEDKIDYVIATIQCMQSQQRASRVAQTDALIQQLNESAKALRDQTLRERDLIRELCGTGEI